MWSGVYVCFLLAAAGQDLIRKRVDIRLYQGFACLSVILAVWRMAAFGESYDILGHISGMSLGLGLLGMGMLSRGRIGAGDGYFFLVSGMMIGFWENLIILCGGILLCGLFCMGYLAWGWLGKGIRMGKRTVPFLPFAVAPGLWMAVSARF